ncbi:hypothetical protein GCM10027294_25440 [Marinactinospora endophytica]
MSSAQNSQIVADLLRRMGIADQTLEGSLRFLLEESGEVAKAVRRGDVANLAEELADVAIVTYAMAGRAGIDLDAAIRAKAATRLSRHIAERAFDPAQLVIPGMEQM